MGLTPSKVCTGLQLRLSPTLLKAHVKITKTAWCSGKSVELRPGRLHQSPVLSVPDSLTGWVLSVGPELGEAGVFSVVASTGRFFITQLTLPRHCPYGKIVLGEPLSDMYCGPHYS